MLKKNLSRVINKNFGSIIKSKDLKKIKGGQSSSIIITDDIGT